MLMLTACAKDKEDDRSLLLSYLEAQQAGQTGSAEAGTEPEGASESGELQTAFVHICGEVISPGVYEVAADARVCDVLLLAGGFTDFAATDTVNMAEKVFDGMQVVIPTYEETVKEQEEAAERAAGRINLNTATVTELCTLPGVGESRANAIIAYREAKGGFDTIEEIMQVDGIKDGIYEKFKDFIYIK